MLSNYFPQFFHTSLYFKKQKNTNIDTKKILSKTILIIFHFQGKKCQVIFALTAKKMKNIMHFLHYLTEVSFLLLIEIVYNFFGGKGKLCRKAFRVKRKSYWPSLYKKLYTNKSNILKRFMFKVTISGINIGKY